jgi:menaquinone-9 beta-reductase
MRADVAIVGGGPAGAMAACRLADAGRHVVLIERERGSHHKVCGEFVSGEARDYLAGVGIDAAAMGASRIEGFRLVHGRTSVTTPLPFDSLGLSRKLIDEALLQAAETRGVTVLRGRMVRTMTQQPDCVRVETSEGHIETPAAILATGKHDLRAHPRPIRESDDHIGLKTLLAPSPEQAKALAGFVEIVLFDGGYAGLQGIDGGAANLCLVVRRGLFATLGNDWSRLLAHLKSGSPHLTERLAGASQLFEKPLAIYRIPYGFLHRPDRADSPRIYRVGDQAAVIPSFCGDGISIALHTGALAAAALLRDADAHSYHEELHGSLASQFRKARMIAALGENAVGKSVLMSTARLLPGVLRLAATATRVPPSARLCKSSGLA